MLCFLKVITKYDTKSIKTITQALIMQAKLSLINIIIIVLLCVCTLSFLILTIMCGDIHCTSLMLCALLDHKWV